MVSDLQPFTTGVNTLNSIANVTANNLKIHQEEHVISQKQDLFCFSNLFIRISGIPGDFHSCNVGLCLKQAKRLG